MATAILQDFLGVWSSVSALDESTYRKRDFSSPKARSMVLWVLVRESLMYICLKNEHTDVSRHRLRGTHKQFVDKW